MKSITQKDALGCGIACVAFVVNCSYQDAKKNFFKNFNEKKGLYCKDIVKAFEKAKKEYGYKKVKAKKQFKENTIVFIKSSERYPYGHYLAKYKEGWMDSWINFPKEKSLKKAESGFRKKLPGKAVYEIFPLERK